MGNSQSKQAQIDVEVPRRSQNRLSKPRTNTTPSNLLSAPSAASRRESRFVLPLAVPEEEPLGPIPLNNNANEPGGRSRRSSLSTRQRIREHLFRSKSSDARNRVSVASREEVARDAAADRWPESGISPGQSRGNEYVTELERQPSSRKSSRPTSRRSSTAFTPYSHHASRLSLVVETNTPEPNMEEASRRLEQLSERAHTERSNSDASIIPIRRRSMLMTPGLATRRDSNGDLLYESFPVSRRLSAADTLGGSRRNSWFDQLNPDMGAFAELPAPPPLTLSPVQYEDAPRTVTPSEQENFALGAYKLGTLRITNADSRDGDQDEDGSTGLTIKIPRKPVRPAIKLENSKPQTKPLEIAQERQQDNDSLSPFSFENSRSPSPQLQTTSKNTAMEDELFEDDQEVSLGSPEHALQILDGTASASCSKPSFERSQTAPVMITNSYGSLDVAVEGSKEKDYKPLTKNDSGYSSNVSLRSFKAKCEARTAASKLNDKEELENQPRRKSEASRSSKEVQLHPENHPVTLASINAPPPLPEKSLEQKIAAAPLLQPQVIETNKRWNTRPNLTMSRISFNASSRDIDQSSNSPSTMSPSSLLRRLTKGRPVSQPILSITSSHEVNGELIPPVSKEKSAKLEERQKDCPTLSHTYKSISRTNSRETLTTILSMTETSCTPAERSPLGGGNAVVLLRQDKSSDLVGSMPLSTTEERTRTKTLQKRASKERQPQGDFESHITSFGTVSQSLGASPYDLAMSAITPHKRSQSSHTIASDHISASNRSHSSNDLAPYHISSGPPKARTGMDANTAAQFAREKSRDREIGRRASSEQFRDDRNTLPSNRMAMRAGITPTSSPFRSPQNARHTPSTPISPRTPQQPPITMSAYRKSHPAQPPRPSATRPTVSRSPGSVPYQGPAASGNNGTYPHRGPWVPQRPQLMHYSSANDAVHAVYDNYRNTPQRPSYENSHQFYNQSHNPPFNNQHNNFSPYTNNLNSYPTHGDPTSPVQEPQVLDRYSGGLAHEYEGELGASAGMRNTWAAGKRSVSADAGAALHYGLDFSDVPVMGQAKVPTMVQRLRQEA